MSSAGLAYINGGWWKLIAMVAWWGQRWHLDHVWDFCFTSLLVSTFQSNQFCTVNSFYFSFYHNLFFCPLCYVIPLPSFLALQPENHMAWRTGMYNDQTPCDTWHSLYGSTFLTLKLSQSQKYYNILGNLTSNSTIYIQFLVERCMTLAHESVSGLHSQCLTTFFIRFHTLFNLKKVIKSRGKRNYFKTSWKYRKYNCDLNNLFFK